MNETKTATTATHDTTTAPPSFDELCEARAAAVSAHHATLEKLLPNLRTRIIAGCLHRGQVEACENFGTVVALQLVLDHADELAAAGVPDGVPMDWADELLFGPSGRGAVPAARRAAARDALARPLPEVANVLRRLMKARA
jgi:hypothetical protein